MSLRSLKPPSHLSQSKRPLLSKLSRSVKRYSPRNDRGSSVNFHSTAAAEGQAIELKLSSLLWCHSPSSSLTLKLVSISAHVQPPKPNTNRLEIGVKPERQ